MNHDLLIAKLGAYGFQEDALAFMWEKKISGVLPGSVLGLILFNTRFYTF